MLSERHMWVRCSYPRLGVGLKGTLNFVARGKVKMGN